MSSRDRVFCRLTTFNCSRYPFKPHSARTGRTVFSQLSATVVRHRANDGVTSMRSERGLSTILHCLQWYKLVLRTRLSKSALQQCEGATWTTGHLVQSNPGPIPWLTSGPVSPLQDAGGHDLQRRHGDSKRPHVLRTLFTERTPPIGSKGRDGNTGNTANTHSSAASST